MNLFGFIDKYGCYTFDELAFLEVDNLIFSSLSYLELDKYVSKNRFQKKSIFEVGEAFFKDYSKKVKRVLAVKQAIKVFKNIYQTRRYKDLYLYNYVYDAGREKQFSALTIEISSKLVYVSFEGTDQSIGGWRENFMLSYQFPVLSQRRAIDYVNKHFLFRRCDIILGGHSKGGNLALVAGMYANFLVRDRIIKIYNNDGPGLLSNQFHSKYYQNVIGKLVHIIPNYSVVGLILRHDTNYQVVRSFRRSIYAHDLTTWVVLDKNLEKVELSLFSKRLEKELEMWLEHYGLEERRHFVESLFVIFEKANIYSLVDIMEHKFLLFSLVNEMKGIDSATKKIIQDFLKLFFKCFKDVTKEELHGFFVKK